MKLKFICSIAFALCISLVAKSQATFSVSPGFGFNGAQFGYKTSEKFIPYLSFQFLNASVSYSESGERTNDAGDGFENYMSEEDFAGGIYIPTIGAKYFLKSNGNLKSFIQGGFSKPFVNGKVKNDEEENENLQTTISGLSIWGGEFSFGVEYFFDANFSLGGEFGLRGFHAKYTEENEVTSSYFEPGSGSVTSESTRKYEYKLNVSPTFSRISLNYYF